MASWDPGVQRWRGPDGRFTKGPFGGAAAKMAGIQRGGNAGTKSSGAQALERMMGGAFGTAPGERAASGTVTREQAAVEMFGTAAAQHRFGKAAKRTKAQREGGDAQVIDLGDRRALRSRFDPPERGESTAPARTSKPFAQAAGKRAGSTEPEVVRQVALDLVNAESREDAMRIAEGIRGKQLDAVAKALGSTMLGRTVDEKRRSLAQSAIGSALDSAAIRFGLTTGSMFGRQRSEAEEAADRARMSAERGRFLRDYRARARKRVLENTSGKSPTPLSGDDSTPAKAGKQFTKAAGRKASATRADGLDALEDHQLRSLATEHEMRNARTATRANLLRGLRSRGAVSPYRDRVEPSAPSSVPSAAAAGVSGRMSDEPLLPNKWGMFDSTAPVAYHEDGEIGMAVERLGDDGRLQVHGGALANMLGRAATDTVRGRLPAQNLVSRIEQIAVQLPEGSRARQIVDRLANDLDAPDIPTPQMPPGAPPPLQQLAIDLQNIPLARGTKRIGGGEHSRKELDALQRLAADFMAGREGGLRFIESVRSLANQRHESQEGKFDIDRAVLRAVGALEDMRRRDRNSLYPPQQRT